MSLWGTISNIGHIVAPFVPGGNAYLGAFDAVHGTGGGAPNPLQGNPYNPNTTTPGAALPADGGSGNFITDAFNSINATVEGEIVNIGIFLAIFVISAIALGALLAPDPEQVQSAAETATHIAAAAAA